MANQKFSGIRIHYKIWMESCDKENILGDGKIELLKYIDATGSISAAAESLGISYRKAWGDIKKAEALLGFELLERQRGGESGGSSQLTPEAKHLVEAWEHLHNLFQATVTDIIKSFKRSIKGKNNEKC